MRLRVACDTCGTVDVEPQAVVLRADDREYDFECPTCQLIITKPANDRIIDLLRIAEVPEVRKPVVEPEYKGDAPVLTIDDVIALHFELEDEGNIETWMRGG